MARTRTTLIGADRLGDDVLAVIEAVGIARPLLAWHSLGGGAMT